jgi:hypothetical protein
VQCSSITVNAVLFDTGDSDRALDCEEELALDEIGAFDGGILDAAPEFGLATEDNGRLVL